jgi:hypothetical protein
MLCRLTIVGLTTVALAATVAAQGGRPSSPLGTAAAQVGGHYAPGGDQPVYQGGKWMEITYSRPLKRGRDLWGSGANYGKALLAGAPVWRAGANVSTRLKTEVPLTIGGKTVAPGEYSLVIDLKPAAWTLIVSTYGAAPTGGAATADQLWGAFGYTPAELRSELAGHFRAVSLAGQTLDPRFRIPPFWDAQRRLPHTPALQAELLMWRALNKLPPGVRERLSRTIWRRPFYPGDTDYRFEEGTVEIAPVLVAFCR